MCKIQSAKSRDCRSISSSNLSYKVDAEHSDVHPAKWEICSFLIAINNIKKYSTRMHQVGTSVAGPFGTTWPMDPTKEKGVATTVSAWCRCMLQITRIFPHIQRHGIARFNATLLLTILLLSLRASLHMPS